MRGAAMQWMRSGVLTGLTMLAVLAVPAGLEARHGTNRDNDEDNDKAGIFRTLHVSEAETVGDVACAFCTVEIDGEVHGDVAVIFSTVNIGEGRRISGDVATLFSTLRLAEGASIGGDLATALGTTSLAPGATVHGDRAIFSNGLSLLVIVAPFLILAGVIWLLAWTARRAFV